MNNALSKVLRYPIRLAIFARVSKNKDSGEKEISNKLFLTDETQTGTFSCREVTIETKCTSAAIVSDGSALRLWAVTKKHKEEYSLGLEQSGIIREANPELLNDHTIAVSATNDRLLKLDTTAETLTVADRSGKTITTYTGVRNNNNEPYTGIIKSNAAIVLQTAREKRFVTVPKSEYAPILILGRNVGYYEHFYGSTAIGRYTIRHRGLHSLESSTTTTTCNEEFAGNLSNLLILVSLPIINCHAAYFTLYSFTQNAILMQDLQISEVITSVHAFHNLYSMAFIPPSKKDIAAMVAKLQPWLPMILEELLNIIALYMADC
jgi:hypothetical protein